MEKHGIMDQCWLKDWPCKIYVGQWPIFHGLLILPYIIVRLKLFLYIKKWHWPEVFIPLRALALVYKIWLNTTEIRFNELSEIKAHWFFKTLLIRIKCFWFYEDSGQAGNLAGRVKKNSACPVSKWTVLGFVSPWFSLANIYIFRIITWKCLGQSSLGARVILLLLSCCGPNFINSLVTQC